MKKPVLESLSNNAAGLQACNFIKKRLLHRCFPVKYMEFLRTPILKNICDPMLLQRSILICTAKSIERCLYKLNSDLKWVDIFTPIPMKSKSKI